MSHQPISQNPPKKTTDAHVEIPTGVNPAIDMVTSIQAGEFPSQNAMTTVLANSEKALNDKAFSDADKATRKLAKDTKAVLDATKEFIESKKLGDRVQTIYKEGALAAKAGEVFPNAEGLTDEDRKILAEMRERLVDVTVVGRDLLRKIITSAKYRENLLEMLDIVYNMFYQVGEQIVQDQPSASAGAQPAKRAKRAKQTVQKELKSRGGRTDEQKKELSERISKFLRELADTEEYQEGINLLFKLADTISDGADRLEQKLDNMDVDDIVEPHTKKALEETQSLAEQFLPENKSLDPLIHRVKLLVTNIRNDQKLNEYFSHWKQYLETIMENPEKLKDSSFIKEGEELTEQALNLEMSNRLRKSGRAILEEWKSVFSSFKQDDDLNALSKTMKKLMEDITKRDAAGNTTLDLDALSRFRPIVVELVKKNLEQIPIPDVSGEDETYKWKAWNLVANGKEILPDFISVSSSTSSQAAIKDQTRPSWLQGDLIISVQNIRTKMNDVNFWYERKTFPSGEDSGVMDIDIHGGINIAIKLELKASEAAGGLTFSGGGVYVQAKDVRIKVRDTKHDILHNMFSGVWSDIIRKSIEKYVAEKLAGAISEFRAAANEKVKEFQKTALQNVVPDVIKQQITA